MTHRDSGNVAAAAFLLCIVVAILTVVAGCSPAPLPQPTPQVVRVEVPGPQPTPQVVRVEVPGPTITMTPAVCVEALNGLDAALQAENTLLMRYADGKEPTEAMWDTFLAVDPEKVYAAVDQCLAATDVGS